MKENTSEALPLPPIPYSMKFDKPKDNEGFESGTVQHRNAPRFTSRFKIGGTPENMDSRIYSVVDVEETQIHFYDTILSDTTDLRNSGRNVRATMEKAANAIYNTVHLPFFRNQESRTI